MDINKLLSIKNKDFFDIKSFVIAFVIYSLISIWFADRIVNQDKKLDKLAQEVKILKSTYVYHKTHLMKLTKQSSILKKAEGFDLFLPLKPIKTIVLNYEH